MVIQCDTREHKKEWERIQNQFDSLEVQYFRSKLYCGDYQSLDNAKLCIDRKKDLQELCGNVCQQHERFKAELIRAREAGIQLIILCEHGPDIKSVGDVYFWENPRKHKVIWRTVNGKRVALHLLSWAVLIFQKKAKVVTRSGMKCEISKQKDTIPFRIIVNLNR